MAKVHVNLTEIEDGGFAPIPPGQYVATIKSVAEKITKDAKLNMLALTFQVKTGELVGANVMLEGKGAFKFAELWNAVTSKKQIGKGDKFDFDTAKLVGKSVGIVVEDDKWEGKIKSKVSQFIKANLVKQVEAVAEPVVEEPVIEMPQPPVDDIPVNTTSEESFDAEIDF